MAEPYLWLEEELGPAFKGALEATVGWPWSPLVPRNSPVAGRDTSLLAGFRVRAEQGMGCV